MTGRNLDYFQKLRSAGVPLNANHKEINTLSNSNGTNEDEQQNKMVKTKTGSRIKWKKENILLLLIKVMNSNKGN